MKEKIILAIETSSKLCSVSLSFEPDKFDERNILIKHIHSEKLISIIDEILKSNKILTKHLYCMAVSEGPGSFTGLRIGMTAAKGIAFASKIPIIPVPTFDALCNEIVEYLPNNTNFCISNSANKDESYFAKFRYVDQKIIKVNNVKLIDNNDIEGEIKNVDIHFGNTKLNDAIKKVSSPRASSIAKWAYLFGEDLLTFEYDYLEPNYLKNFKVRNKK